MNPVRGLLQRVGVLPAERALVLWAVACLVLLGGAGFAILNMAEVLFLKRVGVEALPVALMASSGLLVLTTGAVGSLAARDPARWLTRVLAALALAPLPFVVLVGSNSPLVFGAFVLVARQLLALGSLAFWLAMGSLLPARRAKLLFAPLAAGITIGGIAGSFGSEPLAAWLGASGLLALGAAALGTAALLSTRLRHCGTRRFEHALGSHTTGPAAAEQPRSTTLFRESRLFRLLAVAMLCGGALSPVLYFEFTTVLDAATQGPGGEQQLLGLYSLFRGWLNVVMLVSQLWLSATLYRQLGLPLTLALWPTSYVAGFAWVGLQSSLVPALVSFGATRVTEDGTSASAVRVLYNLFPDGARARASGLLEGPINRLGGMLGNGLVLCAIFFGLTSFIAAIGVPIAALWLLSSLLLWRAYPGMLLRASASHGLADAGPDRAVLIDTATLRSLAAGLVDPDLRVCRAAIDLIVDGERSLAVRLLAEGLDQAPAPNLPLLVAALRRLTEGHDPESTRSEEGVEALASALRASPPLPAHERADLLQVYARLTSGEGVPENAAQASLALLERMLGDRAAPVRIAAVVELHRRGAPPPGLPDLDRALGQALGASDAMIRRAARRALRVLLVTSRPDPRWSERLEVLSSQLEQRADRAETAEALLDVARRHGEAVAPVAKKALDHANDRDPAVRGALLALAGHAGLTEEGARLVDGLGAREHEEAAGAREGLVALGIDAALPLLVGLELGGAGEREAVVSVLRELEVDASVLESLRARQLEGIQASIVDRAALEGAPGAALSLLRRRLEERISEGLGALLDLLAALHADPRLAELERRLRRAGEGRERDLVVEAIEALVGRADRGEIVRLLEPGAWPGRGEAVAAELGRSVGSLDEALARLRSSADPTTRRIAAAHTEEVLRGGEDSDSMSSVMDIAVRLQDAAVFGQLRTQQLVALAELLQEQRLAAGERVYSKGEEGVGLYLVLEGGVELRRGSLLLDRAEPGRFFGELAAVDGLPRSTDAIASEASVVLRLDREDLMRLLEDVPGLAIGLIQLFSSRVRRLQEQLDPAGEPDAEPS